MKQGLRPILAAAAAAAFLTLLAGLGLLQSAEQYVSDWLYQSPRAVDGQILLIGIDQKSLDRYGPYQSWGRQRMAELLDRLNADEQGRPALIGIDVLYSGQTSAAEDEALAAAAGRYDNVLTACAGTFESAFVRLRVFPNTTSMSASFWAVPHIFAPLSAWSTMPSENIDGIDTFADKLAVKTNTKQSNLITYFMMVTLPVAFDFSIQIRQVAC